MNFDSQEYESDIDEIMNEMRYQRRRKAQAAENEPGLSQWLGEEEIEEEEECR